MEPFSKRGSKLRRCGVFCIVLLGLLWANGPGFRVIAPILTNYLLTNADLHVEFEVDGTLLGGFSLTKISAEGSGICSHLSIDRLTPQYNLLGLIRGRIERLTAHGAHIDLTVGSQNSNETNQVNYKHLNKIIHAYRKHLVPIELDIREFSITVKRSGNNLFTLDPSRIYHPTNSNDFQLILGSFTDASGKKWPASESTVTWEPHSFAIPKITPFPGVIVENLVMRLPIDRLPSAEADVLIGAAKFVFTSNQGLTAARIDLREGQLQVNEAAKLLGLDMQMTATLNSLAIELDQILPDVNATTAEIRISLENLTWKDWTSPELSIDVTLLPDSATLAAHGIFLGSNYSINASSPVIRQNVNFNFGDVVGKFNLADVPQALKNLEPRFEFIGSASSVPNAELDSNFTIALDANQPQSAVVELAVKPQDDPIVSPIFLKARWEQGKSCAGEILMDGLTGSSTYEIETTTYQAKVDLDGFDSHRNKRWLSIFKLNTTEDYKISAKWIGNGVVQSGTHRGEIDITQADVSRAPLATITASGGIRYSWPGVFSTKDLKIQMNQQTVSGDISLAREALEISNFNWSNGKTVLATGSGRLPIFSDYSKWKDLLRNEVHPIALSFQSKVLPLNLLKGWVPFFEKVDQRTTGELNLSISGTYADPVVEGEIAVRDLSSPTQPKLPTSDIKLSIKSNSGRLLLDGSAVTQDFAPALIKVDMPFKPIEWISLPEQLMKESLSGRVDIPRLDISRFVSLIPFADQISGTVNGNVILSGSLGNPIILGKLDLYRAGLRCKNNNFPVLEEFSAVADLTPDRITLKNLKGTVAGGVLHGEASLDMSNGNLGNLDVRLRGDHLPIIRNDLLILRVNADLRIQGPWLNASMTGTVGAIDSIFYRDVDLLPIGSPFTTPSAAELPKLDILKNRNDSVPDPFRNWGLNLTIKTEDPILIRGNIATGEVTGDVNCGGTLGNPSPSGVFQIKNFRASLPFSTLSVPVGTLTFTPTTGFNPMLDIHGTAEVRPYRVNLYAYGSVSNPQLILTSNPPLPENEIMTLLAAGTTTEGLGNPQVASTRALQLLAEELRRGRFRFGKQLQPLLGTLDQVDFSLNQADPYSTESFSTATVSITDKWFLSAGVGATGDSRALFIWRISFR